MEAIAPTTALRPHRRPSTMLSPPHATHFISLTSRSGVRTNVVRAEDATTGHSGPCRGGNEETNTIRLAAAASHPHTVLTSN